MRRSRAWQYEVLNASSSNNTTKPGYVLVPYRPNAVLRSLRSCPAHLDTSPHIQLLFNERFDPAKLASPRDTLLIDKVCDPPEDLIAHVRASGNTWEQGRITATIAETAGSCQGIHQAIQSAHFALEETGGKLHLTSEVLQTGMVQGLDKGYSLVPRDGDSRDFSSVVPGDIVILPTFGCTAQDVQLIRERGAGVITTVCPMMPGDRSTTTGYCTVIHGTNKEQVPDSGNYIFVPSLEAAQYLGNYILSGDGDDYIEFWRQFQGLTSKGFDPCVMLERIIFTSQTGCSHAKKERCEIEDLLRAAIIEKYGIDRMDDHFFTPDSSDRDMGQERANLEVVMGAHRRLDVIIVVGPFNSRRAKRLQHCAKIAKIPTYWIDSPTCINAERNAITWQDSRRRIGSTFGFLPTGKTLVGVMSDASVSDHMLEEVLQRVHDIQKYDIN